MMRLNKKHQQEEETLSVKSVTEILGGTQVLFGTSFDLQDIFEEYLTEQHRAFPAQSFFTSETLTDLLQRLKSDSSSRKICGFSRDSTAIGAREAPVSEGDIEKIKSARYSSGKTH